MTELNLTVEPRGESVFAGYSCPCGCTPGLMYERDAAAAHEGCCCGNEFAVGPGAEELITAPAEYRRVRAFADAPWGERLPVLWAIGPSTHGERPATPPMRPRASLSTGAAVSSTLSVG